MEKIKIIRINETDSTNRYMRDYNGDEGLLMTIVTAAHQTAGRGQGSNSWESEAGQNLLFSVMTHPEGLEASQQYVMLEAGALAIRDTLAVHADGFTVKWPNDIYWNDCKISGTLSECTVSGRRIDSCILGTGININQREFTGNAPNPISLCSITNHDESIDDILSSFTSNFERYLSMVNSRQYDEIYSCYDAYLYRRHGRFEYEDTAGRFMAEMLCVEPSGHLVLRRDDGSLSRYAFKEVKYIL